MGRYVSFAELPESEQGIGQRIRTARRWYRLSQAKLAPLGGLTRDQLNNVELGRVALRFESGWTLCAALDLNPVWLGTGHGDPYGFADMGGIAEIPLTELFSGVIAGLGDEYDQYRRSKIASAIQRHIPVEKISPLEEWIRKVPPEHLPRFLREIDVAAFNLINNYRADVKQRLTTVEGLENVRSVTWPQLRNRIACLTKARGAKTRLASEAKVSRQVLNAWLTGNGTPSADKTLFLLQWVTAEESKPETKRAGTVLKHRPALKTRKGKSTTNEKTKSGP